MDISVEGHNGVRLLGVGGEGGEGRPDTRGGIPQSGRQVRY